MHLIEAVAKQKQCPMTFNIPSNTAAGQEAYRCIGSVCMAWRWHDKEKCVKKQEIGRGKYCPSEYADLPKDEWTGYCGLAGKP